MQATAPMENTVSGIVKLDIKEEENGNTVITYRASKNVLLILMAAVMMFVPGCVAWGTMNMPRVDGGTTLMTVLICGALTAWGWWYRFGPTYRKLIVRRGEGLILGSGNIPFEDVADIMRTVPANPHHAVEMHIKLKDGQQVWFAGVRNTNVALAMTDAISKMNH